MIPSAISLYRKAYTGLEPEIWWQAVVLLINRSGTMVIPFLTIYLTQSLHFSVAQAGWVVAIFGAGSIVGTFIGGKLTDTIGFYPVQFWSLILNGVLFFILGNLNGWWHVCTCVFVLAVLGEAFRPANASATAYYSKPETKTRSYSLNRLAVNLGFTVGPATGGFLARHDFHWLFWVDGGTCIIAALFFRMALRPVPAGLSTRRNETTDRGEAGSPYRDRPYLAFVFLAWLFFICFCQFTSIVPLYYKGPIHLNETQIGLLFSMNGLMIVTLEMVMVYALENRRSNLHYIAAGALGISACFLVLLLGPPAFWIAVLSMVAFTIGEMLAMPFMNSYWSDRSKSHNRGQYAALYSMSFSAALVVGPALGAQVVEHFGFTWLWALVGGLGLISFAGFRRLIFSGQS